jgi:hypothetical protein
MHVMAATTSFVRSWLQLEDACSHDMGARLEVENHADMEL